MFPANMPLHPFSSMCSVSANIVANSALLLPGIVAAHQNTNIIGLKGTLLSLHFRNFLTKYICFFKKKYIV